MGRQVLSEQKFGVHTASETNVTPVFAIYLCISNTQMPDYDTELIFGNSIKFYLITMDEVNLVYYI